MWSWTTGCQTWQFNLSRAPWPVGSPVWEVNWCCKAKPIKVKWKWKLRCHKLEEVTTDVETTLNDRPLDSASPLDTQQVPLRVTCTTSLFTGIVLWQTYSKEGCNAQRPQLPSLNPEALPKLRQGIAEIADAAIAEDDRELNLTFQHDCISSISNDLYNQMLISSFVDHCIFAPTRAK